mgnify:FL=1
MKRDNPVKETIELSLTTIDNEHVTTKKNVRKKEKRTRRDEEKQCIVKEDIENQNNAYLCSNINKSEGLGNSRTKNRRVVEEAHLIPANSINDIEGDLNRLAGYADEPLLPLYKACAPLTNILYQLSMYIQVALDETPEIPPDDLTIDESAAIRLYTIEWDPPHPSLYLMLNRALKGGCHEQIRPYFKYMKLFLTALAKLPCVPQLTIWRGVTQNLSEEFPPGKTVIWWTFSSCTSDLLVLENNQYLGKSGGRTLFSVEAINGRTIRAHSHFVVEDEILLLPGTQMIVKSRLNPAPDLHIIHLKQLVPQQTLLQPPFEGIFIIHN